MDKMTQIIPWDATDYLKTDEDIAEYLTAAFETGETDDVTHALVTIARAKGMTDMIYGASGIIGDIIDPSLPDFTSALNAMNITLSAKPNVAA